MKTHMDIFDLEISDGRRKALAVIVHDVRVQYRRRGHVVGQHVHQQIHVAVLGGQGAPHDIVGACHALKAREKTSKCSSVRN